MNYLLLIYENENALSGEERQAQMGRWFAVTEEMKAAGAYVGGNALVPVANATSVRVREGRALTTDGPFAETKEQLGGYYLVDVPNLDEAMKWAAKLPSSETGTIEVRPILNFE